MKRILLLGGSGQLGTAIRAESSDVIVSPAHTDFDLVTGDAAELIANSGAEVVINCAAFHNVDRCEREPQMAFSVNALAVDRLAAASEALGAAFVTISTDYVFRGDTNRPYREADMPSPLTIYGISKLAGEMLALRRSPRAMVVRTSGVFGTTGTSTKGYTLIEKVLGQAERGEPTRMVADVTFSPSYAPHVARAILKLIDHQASGIHHVTNGGACTWYDYVRTAYQKAGLGNADLIATSYADLANATPRPMYSPLENTTFATLAIEPMPPWEAALDEFLVARTIRRTLSA
jgi:dTDP-4-dehydrorhamnose reductase